MIEQLKKLFKSNLHLSNTTIAKELKITRKHSLYLLNELVKDSYLRQSKPIEVGSYKNSVLVFCQNF